MEILDVDLLAFESGSSEARRAVVDGVARSLVTGFVYVEHDLSVDLIDEAYDQLEAFFTLPQGRKDTYVVPGSNGQTGYTGLLVETAAIADVPDWKEMLNWGAGARTAAIRCGAKLPAPLHGPPTLSRERRYRASTDLLLEVCMHERLFDLQRRMLRVVALEGLGVARDATSTSMLTGRRRR